ncbi:MAG: hypothetical protein KH021_16430, partial [Ruminococcus sp.]|nr:hypothetical protein [Ruminococcus sp.]
MNYSLRKLKFALSLFVFCAILLKTKQQLQKLLELGGNCVFTSGRPISPDVLQLTDEAGILVVAEMPAAGLVAKDWRPGEANFNKTDIKSRLLDTHKDTIDSLITRDKNHPSVVIWSLGNEATYQAYNMDENYCFYNSTQWILQRDPSRIRKYERDNRYTKGDRKKSMVDIYSSQYWGVDSVKSQVTNTGNKLPYIQSEYAHAMGNALGNFKEYWDIFRNYP